MKLAIFLIALVAILVWKSGGAKTASTWWQNRQKPNDASPTPTSGSGQKFSFRKFWGQWSPWFFGVGFGIWFFAYGPGFSGTANMVFGEATFQDYWGLLTPAEKFAGLILLIGFVWTFGAFSFWARLIVTLSICVFFFWLALEGAGWADTPLPMQKSNPAGGDAGKEIEIIVTNLTDGTAVYRGTTPWKGGAYFPVNVEVVCTTSQQGKSVQVSCSQWAEPVFLVACGQGKATFPRRHEGNPVTISAVK